MQSHAPFESRHPLLLHRMLFFASLATYVVDRHNAVLRAIGGHADAIRLEHLVFGAATLLVALAIVLRHTSAHSPFLTAADQRMFIRRHHVGDVCFALALTTLFPVSGSVIWLSGEILRASRFSRLRLQISPERASDLHHVGRIINPAVRRGVFNEAITLCVLFSVGIFAVSLQTRIFEMCMGVTIALAFLADSFASPRTRHDDRNRAMVPAHIKPQSPGAIR